MDVLFNTEAKIDKFGNIHFDNNQFQNAVNELKKPETRNVRILIIQDHSEATKKQLAFYHGFLIKDVLRAFHSIGDGITEKEADEQMRRLFLNYYHTNIETGRKVKIIRTLDSSSPDFPNTKQISEFFEQIVMYCASNMNYIINLPDDFKEIDLNFNRIKK